MPEPKPITTPSGRIVQFLELDSKLQSKELFPHLRAFDIFKVRPAQASDLATALLQDPCEHRLAFVELLSRSSGVSSSTRFLRWYSLRYQFGPGLDGDTDMQSVLAELPDYEVEWWRCYLCRASILLVRFSELPKSIDHA